MVIVDSHCHLDLLKEVSISDAIKFAKESNVEYMQTICTRIEDFPNILEIAKTYPNIFTSIGVHPSNVSRNNEDVVSVNQLLDLSDHERVIAFGETGLDFYYNHDENQQNNQKNSFYNHLLASLKASIPSIIHTRSAGKETIEVIVDILSNHRKDSDLKALIHCFTEDIDFARKMLDMGIYISISGISTFKKSDMLRDVIKYVPLSSLLVETDAPYLSPAPHRGKENQPAFTKYVVELIANVKNISIEEVAKVTTENFFRLFSKAKK